MLCLFCPLCSSGISASLDALLVGMALGLQKIPLPARHNLLISTVTLIGTVISIGLGNLLLPLFPIGIGTRIGSSVLILFGLYYVGKWLLSRWRCNFSPDNNLCQKKKKFAGHRELSLSQILALGCALSMNQYRHRFLCQYYGTSFPSGIGVHLFLLLRISGFRKPSGQVCFPAADRGIYGSRLRFIVDPAGVVSIIPLIRIVPKNLGNLSE